MKLEDLYEGNKALVVKKIEGTTNDWLVAGKGAATGVLTIPATTKMGDYVFLKEDEGGGLVFDKVEAPAVVPEKGGKRQGCAHVDRELCSVN